MSDIRESLGLPPIGGKSSGPSMLRINSNNTSNDYDRKRREEEEKKRREEEARKQREAAEQSNKIQATKAALKAQEFQDPNPTSFTNFTEPANPRIEGLPQGRGRNRDSLMPKEETLRSESRIRPDYRNAYREEQERVLSKYKDFSTDLINDLKKTQEIVAGGVPKNERGDDFTPPMLQNVDAYFKVIEYSLKPGEEKVIQNMSEGAAQRIVQNALSMENVRKMKNLPNKVDEIEKWLEDHPELNPNANARGEKQSIPMRSVRGLSDVVTLGMLSKAQALPNAGKYAAAGAVGGAIFGNTFVPGGIVLPEEALTVPAGAALGFRYGMTTGSAKYMMQLEAGSSYAELLEDGVDPKLAKKLASTVGFINGIIEYAEVELAFKGIKGFENVTTAIKEKAVKSGIYSIGKMLARYGGQLAGEATQEVLQEAVGIAAKDISDWIKKKEADPNFNEDSKLGLVLGAAGQGGKSVGKLLTEPAKALTGKPYDEEYLDIMIETAKETVISMALLPVGSTMVRTGLQMRADSKNQALIEHNKVKNKLLFEDMPEIIEQSKNQVEAKAEDLVTLKEVLNIASDSEGMTNKDKKQIGKLNTEIDEVTAKMNYDAKVINPEIQFKPTNAEDIEMMILDDNFSLSELATTDNLSITDVEVYKDAKKLKMVNIINNRLKSDMSRAEIVNEVTKMLPKKNRNVLYVQSLVDAVENVQEVIKAEAMYNSFENIKKSQEVIKQQEGPVEIEKDVIDTNTQEITPEAPVAEEIDQDGIVNDVIEPEKTPTPFLDIKSDDFLKGTRNKKDAALYLWKFLENREQEDWGNYLSYLKDGADVTKAEKLYKLVMENENAIGKDRYWSKEQLEAVNNVQDELYKIMYDDEVNNDDLKGLEEPETAPTLEREGRYQDLSVSTIHTDPERFQFRFEMGGEDGVSNSLGGAEYNPRYAGSILVWQDENGDYFVVNGHHRLAFAKESGIENISAEIITYQEMTAEEARAEGAMMNIAEGKATAIDVAKVLRDSTITEADINKYVNTRGKIARDGIALAKLNDFLFTQAATKAIPHERAVIIGKELGDNKEGQTQFYKALKEAEAVGKNITNDVMTELIAIVKGTAQEQFEVMTLAGLETMTANYSIERAELAAYVKGQLKSKVSVLKNVTKEKNAAMLNELGNKIALEDNVAEMTEAEQALFVLDKSLIYEGTTTNKLFNELAKEYAEASPQDKMKIKKKALKEITKLMEGGKLLNETINQKTKRESLREIIAEDSGNGTTGPEGLAIQQQELENQVDLFGQETVNQLREQEQIKVINAENVKHTKVYGETIAIANAMKKNIFLNGLKIQYSGESSIRNWTREELDNAGYKHFKEGPIETNGAYHSLQSKLPRTIVLNNEGDRTTIVEEAIHDIQSRAEEISPKFAAALKTWEDDINSQARELGLNIPEGKELFAQAYVYGELGHAEKGSRIAELIAIDDDLVEFIEAILGEEILNLAKGEIDPQTAKEERKLRTEYKNYAQRLFMDKTARETLEAARKVRMTEMEQELSNNRAVKYRNAMDSNYVIISPSTKGGKYQMTTFSDRLGPISDAQFDNLADLTKRLISDGMTYKADEVAFQLKQHTRDTLDGIYERAMIQENFLTDSRDTQIEFTTDEYITLLADARIGNISPADFDNLILNNDTINVRQKNDFLKGFVNAALNGYDLPNSEVLPQQFLYRFYGISPYEIRGNDFRPSENALRYNGETKKIEFSRETYQYVDPQFKSETDGTAVNWNNETLDIEKAQGGIIEFDSLEDAMMDFYFYTFDMYKSDILETDIDKNFSYTAEMMTASKGNKNVNAAKHIILTELRSQYQDFKNNIETYRHKGLDYNFDMKPHYAISYQLKEAADTESDNFKKWFKDSKVVDKEGKPLVVYHGTQSAGFNQFNNWRGIYFTNSKHIASGYAFSDDLYKPNAPITTFDEARQYALDNNMELLERYWDANKGIYDTREQLLEANPDSKNIQIIYEVFDDEMETIEIVETLEEAIEMLPNLAAKYNGKQAIYEAYVSMQNPLIIEGEFSNWMDIKGKNTDQWVDYAKIDGKYDGVIFKDIEDSATMDSAYSTVYVAFNPTQIKSVYNNGMFNEYAPNINYQLKEESPIDVDGFYSQLETVLRSDKIPNKAPGLDMYNLLKKNGVKAEELQWFNIESLIDEKAVTKEQILELMEQKPIKLELEDMGDKFKSYTLPGGDNYTFNAYVYEHNGKPYVNRTHFEYLEDVIGHTRYQDFVDANGNKVLFIEELQSDWHQKGRAEGYHNENIIKELKNKLDSYRQEMKVKYGEFWWDQSTDEEQDRYRELEMDFISTDTQAIPDAPLKESITDFLFKQAIKDAVEGGYDKISWTTGEQQAERWSVGAYVSSIGWHKQGDGSYNLSIKDKDGNLVYNEKGQTIKDIGNYIGDGLAKEIENSTKEFGIIEGEGLHVGGDFYKKLYNNYIPRMIRKYGKKWGIKLEAITINEQSFNVEMLQKNIKSHVLSMDTGIKNKLEDRVADIEQKLSDADLKDFRDSIKAFNGREVTSINNGLTDIAAKAYFKAATVNSTGMVFASYDEASKKIEIGTYVKETPRKANEHLLLTIETPLDSLTTLDILGETFAGPYSEAYTNKVDVWGGYGLYDFAVEGDNKISTQQLSIPVTNEMIEDVMTQGQPLFQLKEMEGPEGLVAIHNMSENNLINSLKLGGLPYPSIAITKQDIPHENFGEISLIFKKDTIDPKALKANKVYSRDAYTQTFPEVGVIYDEKKLAKVADDLNKLADGTRFQWGAYKITDRIEDRIDADGLEGAIKKAADDVFTKAMYLLDNGIEFETFYKQDNYSRYIPNKYLQMFLDMYPGDKTKLNELRFEDTKALRPIMETVWEKYFKDDGIPEEYIKNMVTQKVEKYHDVTDFIDGANKLANYGERQVIDENKSDELIKSLVTNEQAEEWLADKIGDIVIRMGIRNDKDMFTPSGNRRSKASLYGPYDLENVLKVMKKQQETGVDVMFPNINAIAGAASKTYNSIAEIKADSYKIQDVQFEDMEALTENKIAALNLITDRMLIGYGESNPFIAGDRAKSAIIEIARETNRTKSFITKELKSWGMNVDDSIVNDIQNFLNSLEELPTRYFEAKPRRGVMFDEVAVAIVPNTIQENTRAMLEKSGTQIVVEYDPAIEGDRKAQQDQVLRANDVLFQLKPADTTTPEFKKWFKDSKVVDYEGKPLITYHSGTVIDNFDTTRGSITHMYGNGSYFASGEMAAEEYSDSYGRHLGKYYLSMQNLYNDKLGEWEKTEYRDNLERDLRDKGFTENDINFVFGYRGAMDRRWNYRRLVDTYLEITGKEKENYNDVNILLQNAGYDGIEGYLENGATQYVVWNPSNIKSIDNRGTWSATDPNIYYQLSESQDADFEPSKWKETVQKSEFTDENLKTLLQTERLMYEVKHNPETIMAAAHLIDAKGEDYVYAMAMSDLKGDEVLFAASQILIAKYQGQGLVDKARDLIYKTSEKATNFGQAIQILSIWNRETPQGIVRLATGEFKKLMTGEDLVKLNERTDTLIKQFEALNRDTLEEMDIEKAIKDTKELTPEELLARRIANTLTSKNKVQKDAVQMMVDTLFEVAKETPLPNNKVPSSPMELIVDAIVNREAYREVWEASKVILEEKLQDSPDKLAILDDFFNKDLIKTFADSQLKRVVDTELKEMNYKIKEVVKEHFSVADELNRTLVDKLILEANLEPTEAAILAGYIQMELDSRTKAAKEAILDRTFQKRQKNERKTLDAKLIELSNLGAFTNKSYQHLVAEKLGLPSMSDELFNYIYTQAEHIQTLEQGSREREVQTALLIKELSKHLPVTKWSKVSTLQAMAHLLNIRTTLRNLIGNEVFGKLDTVTMNYMGVGIDKAMSMVTGERTTQHRNLFKLFGTQYAAYGEALKIGIEDAKMGINTFEQSTKFELRKTRTFDEQGNLTNRILSKAETVMDITMRATDRAAFSAAFADSIQEQLLLSGLDVPTEQMIENATQIGLYRTFNDETSLSKSFKQIKRSLNLASSFVTNTTDFGLGELVLKYPSTPANILARFLDYSPVGLYRAALNFAADKSGDSYMKQRMAVEGIARGLTGSALIAVGAILAHLGIVTGGKPEEDKNVYALRKESGLSDYSFNVSAFKRHLMAGFNFSHKNSELRPGDELKTYDWMEPVAMNIAVGANTIQGNGTALGLLATITNALEAGVTQLTDQPLLTGLSNMFGYGNLAKGISNAIYDLPASMTPQLFSHIANAIDPSNKDAWTYYPKGRQIYNSIIRKVPFAKAQLPDRYGRLGDKLVYYPENTGVIKRIFKSMVSPSNSSTYKPTKTGQFLLDLYENTGDSSIIPKGLRKSYTFENDFGEKNTYTFTPESHEILSEWVGKEFNKRLSYAINNYMQGWNDADKIDEIKYILKDLEDDLLIEVEKYGTKN